MFSYISLGLNDQGVYRYTSEFYRQRKGVARPYCQTMDPVLRCTTKLKFRSWKTRSLQISLWDSCTGAGSQQDPIVKQWTILLRSTTKLKLMIALPTLQARWVLLDHWSTFKCGPNKAHRRWSYLLIIMLI